MIMGTAMSVWLNMSGVGVSTAARINAIRIVLTALDYSDKDMKRVGAIDQKIVRNASGFSD